MNVNLLKNKIYLDYNATTPLDTEVIEAIHDSMYKLWGNPSSVYFEGALAKAALCEARKSVAATISANSNDILFLSGGTEANNWVIHSVIRHFSKWKSKHSNIFQVKPHIITTNVEHDSVRNPLEYFDSKEIDVTYVSTFNIIDAIKENIRPYTCLISVMLANNETGVVFPIHLIGSYLKGINKTREAEGLPQIYIHTDAAQAVGKLPVDVTDLHVDYLTIVGHKFYGPRIGALYVRNLGNGTPLYPMFFGGGQERGFRPGTENTPMIVGLGKACALVHRNLADYNFHMEEMRNYLEQELRKVFGRFIKFNCVEPCSKLGSEDCSKPPLSVHAIHKDYSLKMLPNTCSISFYFQEVFGDNILKNCSSVMASTGSACHSESQCSSVLENSGVCSFHARRTIRLSVGRETNSSEIDAAVKDLFHAVNLLVDLSKYFSQDI